MITVAALRNRNWANEYDVEMITITKDGVSLELNQEECQHLFSVLKGKEEVAQSALQEGEYLPKTVFVVSKSKKEL